MRKMLVEVLTDAAELLEEVQTFIADALDYGRVALLDLADKMENDN